ncbi:MAG: M20/M25/M40 family metallo-hydrolase [Candidatus Solibacter usitatus]|nr:M20/M25/M40 family metallo-hydrolase [Candidatus Solibacter usitatus]
MLGPLELGRKRPAGSPAQALPSAAAALDELASRPGVREVLRFFARERRWIDEQHLAVCRVPAPTFLEQKRAEWITGQLNALGWTAAIDRAGNVTAHFGSLPRDLPLVALTAHLDTVLAPRSPEEIRLDGRDRLLGPGVADNGAGLAALLAIARALASVQQSIPNLPQLLLVANVGEEGEGNLSGMKFLCRQSAAAGNLHSVLVLDGPDTAHITAEALACRRFDVAVTGPGGHSWSDHGAANPIHALARAISLFADLRHEEPPRRSPCSWNFGVIEGGSTVNAIPASARVKVDLRSESLPDLDDLSNSLTAALERALLTENERALHGRVSGRVRETGSRPGGRLPDDSLFLRYAQAVDAHLGIHSHLDCASTDANIPLSMGIPALSIGAGGSGGGAHTPNEWYCSEGRELGLRRVFLLTSLLLVEAASPEP